MPRLPEPFRTRPKQPRDESTWASRQAHYRGWYGSKTWLALRKIVMHRDAFICQECGKPTGESAHIDHIVPHAGNWSRFTDQANLQTLCASCHSSKTAKDNNWQGCQNGG